MVQPKDIYLSMAYMDDLQRRLHDAFGDRFHLIEEYIQAKIDKHEVEYEHRFQDDK